jgi:hypothetical protein
MGVASADHECEQRRRIGEGGRRIHQHGVDVAFEMIHRDQRQVGGKGSGLCKRDADQQRSRKSRPGGDGDGV